MTKRKVVWTEEESASLTKILNIMNISDNLDRNVWDKVAEDMQKLGYLKSSKHCQEK